jgi:hypothetical protein
MVRHGRAALWCPATSYFIAKLCLPALGSQRFQRASNRVQNGYSTYGRRLYAESRAVSSNRCPTGSPRGVHMDRPVFDPDNGLDVPSKKKGKRDSSKFVYRDEVTTVFNNGKSVLIYQHFTREERSHFVGRIGASLKDLMPNASIWEFRTAHVVFMLAMNPRHAEILEARSALVAAGPNHLFVQNRRVG